MIELIFIFFNFVRPVLFLLLIFYLPMKLGVGFDVAAKNCSAEEVRKERMRQLGNINCKTVANFLMLPFRVLVVVYFSIWLLVDRAPMVFILLFIVTLMPLFSR